MEVELYDGTVLEFPDETKPEVVDRVARMETVKRRVKAKMAEARAPEYSPLEGMGAGQRFAAGAGKAVTDIGRGIKQIGQQAGNAAGLVDDAPLAQSQAAIDESRRLDAPLMSGTAGVLGNVAGNIAVTALPLGIASKGAQALRMGRTATALGSLAAPTGYGSATASGALIGAVQPTATGESRAANTAIGGATGFVANAAANAIGRVAQPIKRALTGPDAAAARVLEAEGVPLSVAQRTGSKAATQAERLLSDNPFTAPMMAKAAEQRGKGFTRAVLKTIGENADSASPDVLARAQDRIGSVMDAIAKRHSINLNTGTALQELADVVDEASRLLKPDDFGRIAKQADLIIESAAKNGGNLPGVTYQKFSSELGKLSMQADVAPYAHRLKDALDDALQAAAQGTDDFAKLQAARGQYRNLMSIAQSVGTDMSGTVSAPKLAQVLKAGKFTKNSWRFGRGNQELNKITRAMVQSLDRFPNSGTAARAALQFAPAGIVAGGSYAMDRDPVRAVKLAAMTYAVPKAMQLALTNPAVANYLVNGLPQGVPRNALAAAGASSWLRRLPIAAVPALASEQ